MVTPKVSGPGSVLAVLSTLGGLTATYYGSPLLRPEEALSAGAWAGPIVRNASTLLGNVTAFVGGGGVRWAGFLVTLYPSPINPYTSNAQF